MNHGRIPRSNGGRMMKYDDFSFEGMNCSRSVKSSDDHSFAELSRVFRKAQRKRDILAHRGTCNAYPSALYRLYPRSKIDSTSIGPKIRIIPFVDCPTLDSTDSDRTNTGQP